MDGARASAIVCEESEGGLPLRQLNFNDLAWLISDISDII